MLFKKRKEKKETQIREREQAHTQLEQGFEDAIQKANQITDPAEKVLALREVKSQISSHLQKIKLAETKAVYSEGNKTIAASLASGAGAGAATGVFGGPIGLAVCVPAGMVVAVAGLVASNKHEKSVRKKLEALSASHKDRLREQANRAYGMADTVIENNVEEISQSPLFQQVKALPGCTEKFANAAAKHIAPPKAPEADALPPAEAAPKKLRLIKRDKHL